jgi:hypothetical protein
MTLERSGAKQCIQNPEISISFGLAKAVDSRLSPKRLLLMSLIELHQAFVIPELYVVLYKPRWQRLWTAAYLQNGCY